MTDQKLDNSTQNERKLSFCEDFLRRHKSAQIIYISDGIQTSVEPQRWFDKKAYITQIAVAATAALAGMAMALIAATFTNTTPTQAPLADCPFIEQTKTNL